MIGISSTIVMDHSNLTCIIDGIITEIDDVFQRLDSRDTRISECRFMTPAILPVVPPSDQWPTIVLTNGSHFATNGRYLRLAAARVTLSRDSRIHLLQTEARQSEIDCQSTFQVTVRTIISPQSYARC
jgi:hypothetical protein